ncbi:MAG: hypothetical protein AAF558_16135 [Verrucomicrobiota bacterium]
MIFARLEYIGDYTDKDERILCCLEKEFKGVEHGYQSDSWIWITEGKEKVAVDSFSSMKHEVKCSIQGGSLVPKVIEVLKREFHVIVYDEPKFESHE